jgi:hypothetical protein
MDSKKTEGYFTVLALLTAVIIFYFAYLGENKTAIDNPPETTKQTLANNPVDKPVRFTEQEIPYDRIIYYTELNGKIAYTVAKDGKTSVYYDNQEIGKEYDSVGFLSAINGKLAYVGMKNGKAGIIYDGQKEGLEYDSIRYIEPIGGRMAYLANQSNKIFIVYGEQELGKEYDEVITFSEVSGKMAYVARKDMSQFIVYDGKEIGKEYDQAQDPIEIDGKLAYVASKDGIYFIVANGKEIAKEKGYTLIYNLKDVNGKIFYTGITKDNKAVNVLDGVETQIEYDGIGFIVYFDGKQAYSTYKEGKVYMIYNGKQYGEYQEIKSYLNLNNKLIYIAKKNGKWYQIEEE